MLLLADRALIAAVALLVSLLLGWLLSRLSGSFQTGRAMHRITAKIMRRMNRMTRAPTTRAMRGAIILTVYMLLAWLLGDLLRLTTAVMPSSWWWHVALLAALLNASDIWLPLNRMARAAKENQWPKLDAYLRLLAPACHAADGHGKLRLGIMLCAQHMQHGITGSLMAYLLADVSGLLAYRAVILCAQHAPSAEESFHALGLVIGWAHTPLTMLSGVLFIFCTLIAGAIYPRNAPRNMTSVREFTASMLNISLGGNYRFYGHAKVAPWVGKGTAKLDYTHARTAAQWLGLSGIVTALLLAIAAI